MSGTNNVAEIRKLLEELISEHDDAIANAHHIEELPARNIYLHVHQQSREKLARRLALLN